MSVRIARWNQDSRDSVVQEFLSRKAFDDQAEEAARSIISDIRDRGDKAVVEYARKFDGLTVSPSTLAVTPAEITRARSAVDADFKRSAREAHKRVSAFSRAGMKKDWSMSTPRGGSVGEQFGPLDRVGVYVPGGAAPLVSTVIMTVTLAKVAGVPEIVVCTPCGKDGQINPALLCALELAGATEIYKLGGVQAIGAMAYGTATIRKVQKIVGPGGTFVTAAKRQVYGQVALDLVAGPSEIVILADETADARFVAADLLSQAEHGTGFEKAVLVTTSNKLAKAVAVTVQIQTAKLSRREAIERVIESGMLIVVVNNLTEGIELCNDLAPEHLEIMVREPQKWLQKVRRAGAVFLGAYTPESAGDFVAGPSHVLPTGGAAAMFSGLTVDDFRRRSSYISFTRADLQDVLPVIDSFAAVEGLDAHGRSARIRFEVP
jgi:histidinol dehydrogenase